MRFSFVCAGAFIATGLFVAALPAAAQKPAPTAAAACPGDALAPANTPTVALRTRGGATYGTMQYRKGGALDRKEIALTFDDGPNPETTPRILDILDRHCIKATFFMVGMFAAARPDLVREVAARGHFIGTHTWSHRNLRHMDQRSAQHEINKGFHAVAHALETAPQADQQRAAPFFRFPGLNDSKPLIAWLGKNDIATLSCDFGADDWLKISGGEVLARAIRNIDEVGNGILILHDTKGHTADMLSELIVTLEKRGYHFVQIAPERTPPAVVALQDKLTDLRTSEQ